jgi:hypothetical protein
MSSYYLQDANGPSAEAILSFSDLVILLIIPISFLIFSHCLLLLLRYPTFRNLLDHQALEFT